MNNLTFLIGLALTQVITVSAAIGVDPTWSKFILLGAFGVVVRVVLGAYVLPVDHEVVLHRGHLTVSNGKNSVFSAPLGDLTVGRSGQTLSLRCHGDLVLQTGESPEAVTRLVREIRDRAKAFGSDDDVPDNLVRGIHRDRN